MKKITFILLILIFTNSILGQITKTKIVGSKEEIYETPYDSLRNFLGADAFQYKGQDLYLIEKSENSRKFGYDNFVLDYQYNGYDKKSNTYKCCDSYNSKYDELKGKYFSVKAIHKVPVYFGRFYLELEEKETKDKIYYKYDGLNENEFPFLVVGFYEKLKRKLVGNEFVFKDRFLTNIETGERITINIKEKWKCTDLTIEEKNYTLVAILQNSSGVKTSCGYDIVTGSNFGFKAKEAEKFKIQFGAVNFEAIMKREVIIGMTKEMCKLSWGEPNDINQTISSGRNSEQWVYSDNYLYFVGNKLTTIQ
ncbi:hypothetical protein [Flavobacterium sp. 7A]|uniref:hypothetical protein n=1 Tax=Flavobacterium sp. 7A TaxID=2940571 RepID=UPI002227DD58|nr:hypothetical protein [Flavobacterium sp. 7A]MCW2119646.1 hypothetical protein [Flavobacterium sp. 7A]